MRSSNRRSFLSNVSAATAMTSLSGPLGLIRPALPQEFSIQPGTVRFSAEIEPLVRWLETTPQDKVVEGLIEKIQNGLPYQRLLTSVFLAGIRNVQPRPNVGFKFHTVLVVHAAHQASMAAQDRDRWLPLLWSADYFKRAQADDVRQGDWSMQEPEMVKPMSSTRALQGLADALDRWDVEAADHYATAAARQCTQAQLFELFAKYGCRDFRDIGHKAIYVAGAFRLLDTIGLDHTEPIVRSLTYAILNYGTGANPSGKDLEADRPGKDNWERISNMPYDSFMAKTGDSQDEKSNNDQVVDLLSILRTESADAACQAMHQRFQANMGWQSAYDAIFLASSEMVMRQQAIVPLHAVTSTNAMHYLFRSVGDQRLRSWLVLQNAAFSCLLRKAAQDRDQLRDIKIDQFGWESETPPQNTIEIFNRVGRDRDVASKQIFTHLSKSESAGELMTQARNLVFCKGTDSHDYKFSSAILEDYNNVSPVWRNHYLAGCSQMLHGTTQADSTLFTRTRELL